MQLQWSATETAYLRIANLVDRRHQGGIASGLEVTRAQARLESTRSQRMQLQARKALLEHAIAALVGTPASAFSLNAQSGPAALPSIQTGVPAQLLQRWPNIAAAQQRVVAAGASVGVARADFFPALALGASAGFQRSSLAQIVAAPSLLCAVSTAPLVTIVDGGQRDAQLAHAQAVLEEAGERYRSVVTGAFREVEDQLALLAHLGDAAAADQRAAAAAEQALPIAMRRYEEAAASYLDVVTAQAVQLQAPTKHVRSGDQAAPGGGAASASVGGRGGRAAHRSERR